MEGRYGQIIKQALMAKILGKKSPLDRPRTRRRDSVTKHLKILKEEIQIDMAYNTEEWNKFVMAALGLNMIL